MTDQRADAGATAGVTRRTHVRRGRITRGQARALAELGERYLLAGPGGALDARAVFGRDAPFGVEIGFGMGHALIDWAQQCPSWNLLGVEVYRPGLGAAMLALQRAGIDHVRLIEAPAEQVFEQRLAPASVDEVRVFFPDPWPKKRHHKRRLIQAPLVRRIADRLRPGGRLWVATDWAPYAEWISRVLEAEPALEAERAPRIEAGPGAGAVPSDVADPAARLHATPLHAAGLAADRPRTRFEARGLRLGHRVWDLRYVRKRSSTESR